MFIKSLLAIVLTAIIAGGVVFYGSQGLAESNSAEVVIAKPAKPVEPKTDLRPQSDPDPVLDDEPAPKPDNKTSVIDPKPTPEAALEAARLEAEARAEMEFNAQRDNEKAAKHKALETVGTLFAQTSLISEDSMRDQAHLDIVIYALRYDLVTDAKLAMGKIKQVELRETARSRIAIALAQAGEIDEAFDIIDAVEIEDLRDVMRLQVIESITRPNFAPLDPAQQ